MLGNTQDPATTPRSTPRDRRTDMPQPDDPMGRPDGHRYDAPETDEDRRSKSWDYLILGILVVVILVLIATGTVPIFTF
jgi:hypothetical protein